MDVTGDLWKSDKRKTLQRGGSGRHGGEGQGRLHKKEEEEMKKNMIEEKIQASGLPMGYILQELGLRSEATFWKQLEGKTMKISKVDRLCRILALRPEEIRGLFAA